jgi:hypothetical protein
LKLKISKFLNNYKEKAASTEALTHWVKETGASGHKAWGMEHREIQLAASRLVN